MSSQAIPASSPFDTSHRRTSDRIGDKSLYWITFGAAIGTLALVAGITFEVFHAASEAIGEFGAGFLTSEAWDANASDFGALDFIYGTAVSSALALLLAGPISIAIGLFLTQLAPKWLRTPIGALIEVLAGIPSVVIGLWGILVMGPVMQDNVEPFLTDVFGWIPLFSGSHSPVGLLPAVFVLTIMIVPIVSSISRELFTRVPPDQQEGALALGATRWEMVRGVMLPYVAPGLVAALMLGLGRAVGEAIAVTQVIGGTAGIHSSLFLPADTLASRVASQYQGAVTTIHVSSIAYLAAILLVLSLVFNLAAQMIIRQFERKRR